jgi:surfeit locus 1 family protein
MATNLAGNAEREAPGRSSDAPTGGVVVPTIATAVALAVLIALGMWQLERKDWKEALIATLAQRLSAPPVALPSLGDWPRLGPADEFLRVTLTATFANDKEGLVYTGGSTLRADADGPGYWVFTPARLGDGSIVMVDRGFVPEGRQNPATREDGQIAGPVAMAGVLRFPEQPGLFTPLGDAAHNLWFARDSGAIAATKGLDAAPFYVELESPEPPGGLPHAAPLVPNLPNNHLQYAVTWFGLATVFAVGYLFWLFGSWRRRAVVIARD